MYLITGSLSLAWQLLVAFVALMLNLLGRAILFVCASIYTVAKPNATDVGQNTSNKNRTGNPTTTTTAVTANSQPEFETMYPELYDFGDDFDTMARVSLETVTSVSAANTSADEANTPSHHPHRTRRLHRLVTTEEAASCSLSSSCSSTTAAARYHHRPPPRRRRQTAVGAVGADADPSTEVRTTQEPKTYARRFSK
ncbi:hypothetical protein QAD02_024224 [Eretmocerus hayati]|uniref:Uncharacterized protein n=1 Tax=Eretmocerus hayati TaxID=131215 RepID=A0ACC2Q0M9_9HYME|nr:hypothetical protein QAD02_024224 [Eretmocerus hayati]